MEFKEEEIGNLINEASKVVKAIADNLAPLVETIKDIIKEPREAINEILECQKELDSKYFETYEKEKVIKHITGMFIKNIYKRKEPP